MELTIRPATLADLDICTEIETTCFPPEQAASRASIEKRLLAYPGHVLLGEVDGAVIGYCMGPVIDKIYIEDEMFHDASCHRETHPYQSVFSLSVLPSYQRQGIGGKLLTAMVELAKKENRQGVTLTCLKQKIKFYESLGFHNHGIAGSEHGGATWYNMVYPLL